VLVASMAMDVPVLLPPVSVDAALVGCAVFVVPVPSVPGDDVVVGVVPLVVEEGLVSLASLQPMMSIVHKIRWVTCIVVDDSWRPGLDQVRASTARSRSRGSAGAGTDGAIACAQACSAAGERCGILDGSWRA